MDPKDHPDQHGRSFKLFLGSILFGENLGLAWAFSDEANYWLKRAWEGAGEDLDPACRRDSAGLAALGTYELAGYMVRIIQCPTPLYFALNYFVALAWKRGHRSLLPWKRTPDDVRYIALESSVRIIGEDGPPSVLGEWTKDLHINYGDGPEPTEESFLKFLGPILAAEQPIVCYTDLKTGKYYEPTTR
jgi:hypothetical protein